MVYFISDLHFCHNRPFVYEPRGFKTIEEMNEAIVRIHNEIVTDDDIVYSLGDEFLCDNEKAKEYLKQLKGQFSFVRGNHTTDNRVAILQELGWEYLGWSDVIKYKKQHFYLGHYPTICSNNDRDEPLKQQVLSLCGHTHTQDPFHDWDKGLIYHVEWDAHRRPVEIEEILTAVRNKRGKETDNEGCSYCC